MREPEECPPNLHIVGQLKVKRRVAREIYTARSQPWHIKQ